MNMTIWGLLMLVLVVVVIGLVAYWVITKFFDPSWHKLSLAIVGILLLLVLISQLVPDLAGYRLWR